MDIELIIENLVVESQSRLDQAELRQVVESELARLLVSDHRTLLREDRPSLGAGTSIQITRSTGESAGTLGRQIAAAVHQNITGS